MYTLHMNVAIYVHMHNTCVQWNLLVRKTPLEK